MAEIKFHEDGIMVIHAENKTSSWIQDPEDYDYDYDSSFEESIEIFNSSKGGHYDYCK